MRSLLSTLTAASALAVAWLSMPSTLVSGSSASALAEPGVIDAATLVFRRAVNPPSAAIPASVMRRARVVAVFPGSVGEASCYTGLGIASARDIVNGNWTAPATMAFEGRIPVSLDVSKIDFIFVALTPKGADYFTARQSSLAAGDVLAPGPLGQDPSIDMNTDILAYMQFGDFFAGVTVGEFSLREMTDANARLYGNPYSTADVWRGGLRLPVAAEIWRGALRAYFRETS